MTIIKKLCLSEEEKTLFRKTASLLYDLEDADDSRELQDQYGMVTITFEDLADLLDKIADAEAE